MRLILCDLSLYDGSRGIAFFFRNVINVCFPLGFVCKSYHLYRDEIRWVFKSSQREIQNYSTYSMSLLKYKVIYRVSFTKVVCSLLIHTEFQFEWCNAAGYQQWELHIYAKPFKCESQTLSFSIFSQPIGCLAGSTLNFHILALIPNRAILIVIMDYATDVSLCNVKA